jgi:serine/threonine-protein kinase
VSTPSYVPLFELAKGGLGRVEVVMRHDGSYERLYVKKRPHARDAQTRATFLDEARLAGLLRHPNVVGVLDVGEDDEGPYLVMDFVEGVHVGELIRGLGGEPIPLEIALDVMRQAADGLHAVHELQSLDGTLLGVVHRDVSPQNLLIGFDGGVRLTDFGIALADRRHGDATSIGVVKGKVGYTAPEQIEGGALDRRTDLFALGVVLVELLTGERLYQGTTNAEVARRIVEDDPPDLGALRRDAPPELVELVFDLLAKSKESRPASAREVAQRLRAIEDALDEDERLEELMAELFDDRRAALRSRVREARDRRLQDVLRKRARSSTRWRAARAAAIGALGLLGLGVGITATRESEPAWEPVVSAPLPNTADDADVEGASARVGDHGVGVGAVGVGAVGVGAVGVGAVGVGVGAVDVGVGAVGVGAVGVGAVGVGVGAVDVGVGVGARDGVTGDVVATGDGVDADSSRSESRGLRRTPRARSKRTAAPSPEQATDTRSDARTDARPSLPPTSWWPRE